MKDLTIHQLAKLIRSDWKSPYFGAVPYIEAMFQLINITDLYGQDSAKSIIRYFLSNASTWRGPIARSIKSELNRRLKL